MKPWHDLTGHVAIVTGGNAGIGLGMARGLCRSGAAIAIWGTNADRNAAAVRELAGIGGDDRVTAMTVDVSDEDAVDDGVARTAQHFGAVDSCFVNAGVGGHVDDIEAQETADWHRTLAVNLHGAFHTMRAAARELRTQRRGGSLVVTSSLGALDGMPRNVSYAASKGAVISMVRSLAVELARDAIRVNALVPGWIDTAMTQPMLATSAVNQKILPRIPLRRWGTPDDFESTAVWLASPGSTYLTGQTIVLDGGYSIY
ncbi:SDR family NAD(P)-dependent oxidoreductase [Antrihabitans stalactiti]|uniref:SDR family oxidoreductase n=1 Tax=Antrihabitans stalactiti TaxID=2584121 RepID=A0A848KAN2_9NOCA|nr:SDR family NAD(P)-dependent oxidoreductase [Antrihabitans stalactiti]NMN95903.1 SDR family oxidoreductase [Antrihabitans stalactiti]